MIKNTLPDNQHTFSFFKCILKKTEKQQKATKSNKKQLKETKSKKQKDYFFLFSLKNNLLASFLLF